MFFQQNKEGQHKNSGKCGEGMENIFKVVGNEARFN